MAKKKPQSDRSAEPKKLEEPAILDAIAYAEQQAKKDDEAFVRVLNAAYDATKSRSRSARGVGAPADAPGTSFQIYKDPRYLENARHLAKRTLGGDRVIGGKPVPRTEFLDCLAVGSNTQWGCTGTLIARDVVITAGHCADFATRVFVGYDVSKPGRVVNVRQRFRHPEYHRGKHNDVMILLLTTPIDDVEPRKVASKRQIDEASDGRVVGFGNTDPRGIFGYGVKRMVDVPIASPDCRGRIGSHDDSVSYGCDPGYEFVAGRPLLARDTCTGDSGGPFYILDSNGKWLLAGATSRATASAMHNCGDGGVYVRVDKYRTWIESIPGVTLP
jgi:secreted trypsin-like serine protease